MKRSLEEALPFAEAFARLLHPFAEVVVHDLSKNQIEAIYNPFLVVRLGMIPILIALISWNQNPSLVPMIKQTGMAGP